MGKRKIIGILRPFDLDQNLFVYEDSNKIDAVKTTIENLNESLFALVEKYNIKQIDLTGPHQFLRGIKKDFKEKEFEKYSIDNIEINLI